MEAAPDNSKARETFALPFGISEDPESTEERPVLRYERNGFVFKAELDVLAGTVKVYLSEKREDARPDEWQVLESEATNLAERELYRRRTAYSEYFA